MRLSSADIRNYVAEQSKTAVVNRKSLPGSLLRKAVIDAGYNRVAQAKLLRLESKRAASRSASRSPANKLARSLIGKRSAIDVKMSTAAHMPLNTSQSTRRNPAVASHIARKAAEVMKAGEMMARLESIKSRLAGPGGKRIK